MGFWMDSAYIQNDIGGSTKEIFDGVNNPLFFLDQFIFYLLVYDLKINNK